MTSSLAQKQHRVDLLEMIDLEAKEVNYADIQLGIQLGWDDGLHMRNCKQTATFANFRYAPLCSAMPVRPSECDWTQLQCTHAEIQPNLGLTKPLREVCNNHHLCLTWSFLNRNKSVNSWSKGLDS